ncbi:hypothetical protein T439DRAFT_353590 [Meredithblackwellia eburnea MCA 4105]
MSTSTTPGGSGLTRRPPVVPTNSLILLLPPNLFAPNLLPLFQAHFGSYGTLESWTPLESLGRCLVVYDTPDSATAARREMDGFIWDDDDEEEEEGRRPSPSQVHQEPHSTANGGQAAISHPARSTSSDPPTPLRAFFGPNISLPLASLHETLLSVPALSRNFLISPPGSPPVGWEQTLEEAPNTQTLPENPEDETGMAWGDELARALRYLSVSSGDDGGDDLDRRRNGDEGDAIDVDENLDSQQRRNASTTHTIIPSSALDKDAPSITLSTPPTASTPFFGTATPPPEAPKITAVKATIESMLGRKRSFGDLSSPAPPSTSAYSRTIIPTARPPLDDEPEFKFE